MEREKIDILARMKIPPQIAINQALKENIYAIIPCLLNKIPIFICGKPGCSKSLSIELIFSNLIGSNSQDDYLKQLVYLQKVPFQGSESCTSEGIQKVFEKAKKDIDYKDIIKVIVFDEIGLAENSKHNPLKVLHSLLELENRDVGFIGISNWRLDASKMNRALYLARPDPEESDLIFTTMSIFTQNNLNPKYYDSLIKSLAISYWKLKSYYQTGLKEYEDFYGLRDFYSLIKSVSKKICQNKYELKDLYQMVKRQIERNFGGRPQNNGSKIFWEYFIRQYRIESYNYQIQSATQMELIEENLQDKDARYLMIISNGDVSTYILDTLLQMQIKDRRVLIGSQFKNDINKEEYGYRSLSDVILYVESGISVIFQNMEHIYSGLYDLFNQNFAVLGDRKYCRIALGDKFNPKCLVHDNYHCIIFMQDDEQKIKDTDPPFLNRFEKHYLTLDCILDEQQKDLVKEVQHWIESFFVSEDEKIQISINVVFPIYNTDVISLLVLKKSKLSQDRDNIILEIKKDLLRTASQDILILLQYARIDNNEKELIKKVYQECHKYGIYDIINQFQEGKIEKNKLLLFTYSEAKTQENDHILIKRISNFNSEQEFIKSITEFYKSENLSLYVLELNLYEEQHHLQYIKYMVDKIENECKIDQYMGKSLILVIYLQRNLSYKQNTIKMFDGWDHLLIDDFSQQRFFIEKYIDQPELDFITLEDIICFKDILSNLTEKCVLMLKYEQDNIKDKDITVINEQIQFINERITQNEELIYSIHEKVIEYLSKDVQKEWSKQIICNSEICMNSVTLKKAMEHFIMLNMEKPMLLILYNIEKSSAFRSYFTNYGDAIGEIIRYIWIQTFKKIKIYEQKLYHQVQNNKIQLIPNLKFPFSVLEYQQLKEIKSLQIQFQNQEEVYQGISQLQNFEMNLQKYSILGNDISLLCNNEELQKLYINDIILIFLDENQLSSSFKAMIDLIKDYIFNDSIDFKEQLFEFINNQSILLLFCKAVDIFQLIFSQNFIQIAQQEQIAEEMTWKQIMAQFIESLIKKCFENSISIQSLESLQHFGQNILKLYSLIYEINNNLVEEQIQNLDALKFLFDLANYWSDINQQDVGILKELAIEWQKLEGLNLIYESKECIESMIKKLEPVNNPANKKRFQLFKMQYFNIVLERQPFIISKIFQEIEINECDYSIISKIIGIIINNIVIMQPVEEDTENVLDQFLIQDNGYLDQLEIALTKYTIESRVGILLNDYIFKYYDLQDLNPNDLVNSLQKLKINLCFFLNNIDNNNQKYNNSILLISLAIVKIILTQFCELIINKNKQQQFSKDEQKLIIDIDSLIFKSSLNVTFGLYCLKIIKQEKRFSTTSKLQDYIKGHLNQYNFYKQEQLDMSQSCQEELYLPVIDDFCQSKDLLAVRGFVDGNDEGIQGFQKRLLEIKSAKDKISLSIAFIKEVFVKHYNRSSSVSEMQQIYENIQNQKEAIINNLGDEFYKLFFCLINNFENNKYLPLSPDKLLKYNQRTLVMCLIQIILFSQKNKETPLTSLFFKDNQFNSEQLLNQFWIGVESDKKYDYFFNLQKNFEELIKNRNFGFQEQNKLEIWKCSNVCDYVCIKESNRELLNSEKDCPWCDKKMLGSSSKGLRKLSQDHLINNKGKDYLAQLVKKYEAQLNKGYLVKKPQFDRYQTFRDLKPLTFRILHLILHSNIYMMSNLKIIDEQTLKTLIPTEEIKQLFIDPSQKEFLYSHIERDFDLLDDLLNQEDSHIWLYAVVFNMFYLLEKYDKERPTSYKIRNIFEQQFQKEIISSMATNIQNQITKYKSMILKQSNNNNIFDFHINEIDNNQQDLKELKYSKMFRMISQYSIDDIKNQFNLKQQDKTYKVIEQCFEFHQRLKQLQSLYDIIQFTNYLLDKFDHKISRKEAKEKQLRQLFNEEGKDSKAKKLFDKFLKAWQGLNKTNVEFLGKSIKNDIDFKGETPLINFLIDNKEQNGGMLIAGKLDELGNIQNKFLDQLLNAQHSEMKLCYNIKIATTHCLIQNAQESSILKVDIDELFEICALNNAEYGKGKQIMYDFERIQFNMLDQIQNLKYLDTRKIHYIQYQFEYISPLGDQSNLISDIRKLVKQQCFDRETGKKLDNEFNLQRNERVDYQQYLKAILSSLDIILCYLKNSKIDEKTTSISQFCSQIKSTQINDSFKGNTLISQIMLVNVIAFYEIIESKYFQLIQKNFPLISDEEEKEVSQLLQTMLNSNSNNSDEERKISDNQNNDLPSKINIETCLMRFIMRCMQTDLDLNLQLIQYIGRSDLWPEDECKVQSFLDVFPQQLIIKHSYSLYQAIHRINNPSQILAIAQNQNNFQIIDNFKDKQSMRQSTAKRPTTKWK